MVYINETGKVNQVWLDRKYLIPTCVSGDSGYDEGFEDGYESGFTGGYDSGVTDGWQPGYDSGFTDGYDSGYTDGSEDGYESGFTGGYDSGVTDGKEAQKAKLSFMTFTENGYYRRPDGWSAITVNVPTGVTINNQNKRVEISGGTFETLDIEYEGHKGYYWADTFITPDEGYTGLGTVSALTTFWADDAISYGEELQKKNLRSVTISQNGTYTRETGWSAVTVQVDTDSYYRRGYDSGYTDGWQPGYNSGYTDGLNGCSGGNAGLIANLQGDYFLIPDGTTHLRRYALYGACFSSITIPTSVSTIGNYAFSYNDCLTSITIPDSVLTLGDCAFQYCRNLETVILSNSLTTLRNSTFNNCRSLTGITIPSSITSIDAFCFNNCSGLTEMTFEGLVPPTINTGNSLGSSAYTFPIYVPCEAVETYKTAFGTGYAPRIMCKQEPAPSGTSVLKMTYVTTGANQEIALFGGTTRTGGESNAFFFEFYSGITRMEVDDIPVPKNTANIKDDYDGEMPSGISLNKHYAYTFDEPGRHVVTFYISQDYVWPATTVSDQSFARRQDANRQNICPLVEAVMSAEYTHTQLYPFQLQTGLTAVTFNSSVPPTRYLDDALFDGCTNLGAIYVPADAVQAYKTSWPDYASLIQAMP